MEQPNNLEDIDRILQQKLQQKERPATKAPFAFIIFAIVAFAFFAFLFNKFFKPNSQSQILGWFLVIVSFTLTYVIVAIFLLNSNLLSDKDKSTIRKFLFLTSPALGWGVSSQDYKESPKFWTLLPFLMLFLGILLFLIRFVFF